MSSSDTKMVPLQFQAGINRERTRYSSKGYWYDGNRVRFRDGQPENIRGWAKKVNEQFSGVARAITSWASLSGASYAAFATDQLLYVYNGGAIYDVTPIATVVCVSSNSTYRFVATSASERITVDTTGMSPAFNTLSITQNTHVIVSTANNTSIAGVLLNGQQFRTSVILSTDGDPDSTKFRLISSTTLPAIDASVITTVTKFSFLLQAGQQQAAEGLGYGTYIWDSPRTTLGAGTGYGTPAPVGSGFTTNARNWSFTLWGEDLIANPYHGRIYQWVENNGTNTRAVAISSAPTENTVVIAAPLDQRLIAAGTMTDASVFDPMFVRWCGTPDEGGFNEWIPGTNNTANNIRLGDGSEIRGGVYSRNQILIWTDNALYGMTATGSSYVFTTQQIGTNCGLVGLHAAVEADGRAYWMSQTDFFVFDGTLKTLQCDIKQYIFNELNTQYYDKIYAGFNKEFTEITWLYVSGTNSECDKYVTYNPQGDWWSFGDAIWTTWEDKKMFDTILTTGSGSYLYDNEPVSVYTGDGVAIESFIESGDFDLDSAGASNSMVFVDRLVPDVQLPLGGSVDMNLSFKRYPLTSAGETTTKGPFTIKSNTPKVSMRGRGRQASIKIERGTSVDNTQWKVGKLHLDMMADGPR